MFILKLFIIRLPSITVLTIHSTIRGAQSLLFVHVVDQEIVWPAAPFVCVKLEVGVETGIV